MAMPEKCRCKMGRSAFAGRKAPDIIANAVLYAVSQPDNVDVSDLAVRPSRES